MLALAAAPLAAACAERGSSDRSRATAEDLAASFRLAVLAGDADAVAGLILPEGFVCGETAWPKAQIVRSLRPGGGLYPALFDTQELRRNVVAAGFEPSRKALGIAAEEVLSYRDFFRKHPTARAVVNGNAKTAVVWWYRSEPFALPFLWPFGAMRLADGRWWISAIGC
ncbi:MAG TPA: hypothetical protein VFP50_06365 [Anaeromyxobacteraceae bacterium]|nr:hypothetical protein [Anaeromyxobacteraceae bacterium]